MIDFPSWVFIVLMMTINNKNERNDGSKFLGWPVTNYGSASSLTSIRKSHKSHLMAMCSLSPGQYPVFHLPIGCYHNKWNDSTCVVLSPNNEKLASTCRQIWS